MHKSDLLSFLNSIGATPRKSLSQNFLIDSKVLFDLVELADIHPNDWVLEIGAGPGAITEALLKKGAHVFAIEKDPLFAKHLNRLQTPDERLHCVCTDFLIFPINTLLELSSSWKVVSNLPFQVTAKILETLCEHSALFQSATLIMQKEVAERIYAKPHTKAMSSLTIFLQFYTELGGKLAIPSTSFFPAPSVESMALQFLFKRTLPLIDPKIFFPIVRKAYQQRRKMLTSTLKTIFPQSVGPALESLGLSSKARPEELSLNEWILLIQKCV